ncbi:molybdate ABC transporter substrate-binding protein [Maribacter sp.]|uniref:molybdate ABC transporter substrate-binding protein n=1 Tax=Maribacter sp. TaxID=1897614 RepID=UPI0025B8DA41|nr:molybdate ABC transporter substrate-binding protein [Maribacter sp.]
MIRSFFYSCLFCIFSVFTISCKQDSNEKPILIATAANMQEAMQLLVEDFTKKTGIKCQLVVSSSGKLTAQIKAGAPYNILVSADMKYPEEIYKSGYAITPPKVYAYGKLVLWSANSKITPSISFLKKDAIQHIAIANPKTAPYGRATEDVLSYYNLKELLMHKFVIGESISQTNQFIHSQAAEIGFTAMSTITSEKIKKKGNWVALDTNTYRPIKQCVIVINKEAESNKKAKNFYSYLSSKEAQLTLTKFGYSIYE